MTKGGVRWEKAEKRNVQIQPGYAQPEREDARPEVGREKEESSSQRSSVDHHRTLLLKQLFDPHFMKI